jgi:hypothetical protein
LIKSKDEIKIIKEEQIQNHSLLYEAIIEYCNIWTPDDEIIKLEDEITEKTNEINADDNLINTKNNEISIMQLNLNEKETNYESKNFNEINKIIQKKKINSKKIKNKNKCF